MTVHVESVESTASRGVDDPPRNTGCQLFLCLLRHPLFLNRLLWFCHHLSLFLATFLHPQLLPPFLPYQNPLNHHYRKSLTQDLIPASHPISTQYSLRRWPNNMSSGSRSRSSTLSVRLMQRRLRRASRFTPGQGMTPLMSFMWSNLASPGRISSFRLLYFQH